jgi:phage shock protein E
LTHTHHPSQSNTPLYVDVRSPGEFAGGHIEGALNLPLDQLQGLLPLLGDQREREIVLYCASGTRSAYACALLHSLGYAGARNGGGIGALALSRQLPVRRG